MNRHEWTQPRHRRRQAGSGSGHPPEEVPQNAAWQVATDLPEARHCHLTLQPQRLMKCRYKSSLRRRTADDGHLWHALQGREYAITVPKHLVPTVSARVHGTYGHTRTARTTLLVARKFHWPSRPGTTQLHHVVAQALDAASFVHGLERTVTDQRHMTQEILVQRHEARNERRERHNERVTRESPGAKAAVDDLVLVEKPIATLFRERHHPKLAHGHYTGSWTVTNVILDRLSFTVRLNGRRIRQGKIMATDIKPCHLQLRALRLPFEDEYAHLVWSAKLGLADTSVIVVPCTQWWRGESRMISSFPGGHASGRGIRRRRWSP